MNDLVEQMLEVFHREFEQDGKGFAEGMTAAAKVCLDAARERLKTGCLLPIVPGETKQDYSIRLLAKMSEELARLLTPKTLEERVTVFDNDKHLGKDHNPLWVVQVDGENVIHLDKKFFLRKDAETYRRGLIAEMRERGEK